MKVLVVGGGGREHALAWKIAQSQGVDTVYVAPGNAGTATENKVQNIELSAEDNSALLSFAIENRIDLTVVGPEAPLVSGIVDLFESKRLKIFLYFLLLFLFNFQSKHLIKFSPLSCS